MTEPRIDKVSATQFDRPGDWIIHLANGETMTLAAVLRDAIAWRERQSAATISRQLDTIRGQAEVVVPNVEVNTWFGEDDTPVVQIDTHRGHGRLRINLNDGVVWDGDPETDERPGKNAELIEWEQRALAQAETISRQLDTIRDQAERIDELEAQHTDALNESTEVIRKCNEQLAAMAATAKLRDQQVETLSRLWLAAFEETGSPVGPVITRQLYRVMADHGIDVTDMPEPLTIDRADCA